MNGDIAKTLVALVPVMACLAMFVAFDVFRLMKLREIAALLIGGGVIAVACYFVAAGYYANWGQVADLPIGFTDYSKWVAPVVEETLKGLLIVGLFSFNRVGYLVDAAISGFAIGAGFSLVENVLYLHDFMDANMGVWLVRGLGTGVMHGGATAILATSAQALIAPRLRRAASEFRLNPLAFLPGLAAAIALHSAYNHFAAAPLVAMAIVVIAVPIGLFVIFSVGETYAHRWLAEDRGAHAELLAQMESGAFAETVAGQAVQALADRLDDDEAADLMAYVRLHTELVARAEATLMAMEGHEKVELGAKVRADFDRLHALEKKLGRTVVAAVRQHLRFSRNDLWEMHELEEDVGSGKT